MSHDHTTPPEPSASVTPLPGTPPEVKPLNLIASLTIFGAIAGALIVVAFTTTKPKIDQHRAETLGAAITEVLAAPATVRTIFVYRGQLVDSLPAGVDSTATEIVPSAPLYTVAAMTRSVLRYCRFMMTFTKSIENVGCRVMVTIACPWISCARVAETSRV